MNISANQVKIIKSGKLYEVYIAQYGTFAGKKSKVYNTREISPRTDEYKKRNNIILQNKIRRLTQSNFNKKSTFITLTFNNENNFDICNEKEANKRFKLFITRLKRHNPKLKYLVVPERQKRGAIHYHMLTNYKYISIQVLEKIWGYGFVNVKKIDNSSRVGLYISKYISKDNSIKTRRLITSQNLDKPVVFYGDDAMRTLLLLQRLKILATFTNTYESQYNGVIRYIEYNLYKDEICRIPLLEPRS